MDNENSLYEIMFILKPDLGEQKTQEELEEVRNLITSNGGAITFEDIWGIRDFAYTIKKYDQGYYVVLNFSMPPKNLKELDKPLILNQEVIRYLITKTPTGYNPISMTEYEDQWAKEAKDEKDKKDKDEEKKSSRKKVEAAPKKEEPKKEEPKEVEEKEEKTAVEEVKEVVEEAKEEAQEEVVEEEVEKLKEPTDRLKEVDEKLKNIINDPDISL